MSQVQHLLTEHIDIWTAADTGKKSGRGRASSNAGSVYGIRKLRELILELAVRGKLVPQDANDEPASELLKRIQAEKAKLVAGGRVKKETPLSPIKENEKPFKLPRGWEWLRFGDALVSRDAERKPISADERQSRQGEYDYYGASGVIDKIDEYLFDKPLLLIGEDGANLINRSTPIAFIARGKYWVNNHAHVLDGISEDYLRYIELFINAINLEPYVTGTAQPKMNQAKMNSIVLGIPAENEQHRIVAKVDELMALCDQLEAHHSNAAYAHEQLVSHLLGTLTQSQDAEDFNTNWQRIATHFDTLFTTEASIDFLKQTLLQLAVMGKLVPQDPKDEPASELLKRIQAEKAKLLADDKIKKDKPLAAVGENEKSFELPPGWDWVRLGAALDIAGGVTLGRKIVGEAIIELPYLRVANVQRGYLILDNMKTVEIKRTELGRYQLLQDDLLVTEGGDWDKVGRTAIWNNEIDSCLHQNHIFRMRGFTKELSSLWIEMYMNSIAKKYFQAASKQTTNLASINMTQLKNCLLAIPGLKEQHRIVAKVDELMSLCEQLKSRITDARQSQKKLADVLVEQALETS
ncbi:MAG: restriction endonuclease subunit S [Burkholderiaceae bacterium]|nr:restriction endonuclease subunit S [Burkholderiaceae bacterium]